jgi:hypothetical protein
MIEKKGDDSDFNFKIEKLRETFKEKLELARNNVKELQEQVNNNEEYQNYIELTATMDPYFKMWKEADSKIGLDSVEKGDSFEKMVK